MKYNVRLKQLLTVVSLIFSCTNIFAQGSFTLSGRVIDKTTQAPLQAASVFAQNTTFGTATDAGGNFKIKLPYGGYDLAITFTGYETESIRINTASADEKPMVVELKPKDKAMEAVAIIGSNEVKDGWEKYGSFFMEHFIGKTAFSSQCTLLNKETLKFYFSKRKNRLKVLATEAVQVKNEALGYTIKYTLDSFIYEYGTELSLYSGYPLFEEMTPQTEAQKAAWEQNRQVAYNGSILHFMRSLHSKRLKEEGFQIQFLVKNGDAENAIEIKNYYGALNYSRDDSTQIVEIMPNQLNLAVLFTKEKPDSAWLAQADADAPKGFQFSFLTFTPQNSLIIEQNGFYYDQNDIAINSYWTWEKAGDMLPYDYRMR
jgi:CarboxypepD_reg-like domain